MVFMPRAHTWSVPIAARTDGGLLAYRKSKICLRAAASSAAACARKGRRGRGGRGRGRKKNENAKRKVPQGVRDDEMMAVVGSACFQ